MLISQTDLDSKGSRDLIPLECYQCGKTHYRTKNIVLRILNGSRQGTQSGCFCSRECGYKSQSTKQLFHCKQCDKEIYRSPSEIGKHVFCSKSCSAIHNNKTRIILKYKHDSTVELKPILQKEKIIATRKCIVCNNTFILTRRYTQKYCSIICQSKDRQQKTWHKIENGEINNHASKTMKSYLLFKRGNKCEICGITEWQGKPLMTIMDHINGNSNDWNLSNLRLICSNCDTLTPTYKGKNKGHGRHYRRIRYAEGKSF